MTRRQRRNRFSQWLSELFVQQDASKSRRPMLVEPLESRQLLAGDTFLSLLGSQSDFADATAANSLVGEGELTGEGEDAIDHVALAKAINDSGTRFFGAAWCEFCTEQKELFQDGYKFLPFIEVTNPDRTPNSIATDENITEYPTWEFPDGTRLTGVQSLETLAARAEITTIPQSSTPSFDELDDVTVGIGSPLHIPVDAYDPNGDPLTITVTSSNTSLINAEVLSGNRSLVLSTAGFGDMVFELFEGRAPTPTGRVIELAEDGFYDGISFHRVINNFVIQGGDPTGTGSGGSTLGDFDDEFHLDLQHNATGILSYAKAGDDTNDSQFFITEGSQRSLDFNHSVFGTLVEGEAVREAISNTTTGAGDRPTNAVVIESASIITDTENGVIVLRPTGQGTGTATITVTVADGEGNQTSRTFVATVAADTANGAPFLNPIAPVQTSINTPVTVNLTAQDKEGDAPVFSVQALGTTAFTVAVDSSTGVATVTPPTGFTGELQFRATVQQSSSTTTGSTTDTQVVTVSVSQSGPTGLDLTDASDSGSSNSDNITNAQSLVFTVSGTEPGATVNILSGGNVVGSATATGSTTTVNVTNVSGLGQGSVLFTSNQTNGGQTSGESPGLSVTLDNAGPAAVDTSSLPASAVIDQALSIDLLHAEEGQGLTYSIVTGPAGASIGAADGVLTWTPTAAQIGAQTISLRLTDTAGNQTDQDISINVIDTPLVRFTLNTVDLNGAPITTIAPGQQFKVQFIAQDLRSGADARGVFAAYTDILFDPAVIEPIATDPISYNQPYVNSQSGDTSTAGLINELGAFGPTSELDGDPRVIAEVTFVALAAGNALLRTESADVIPGSNVLVFGDSAAVPETRVDYQNNSFAVGADFELVNDVFNFDEDSGTQSLDVLQNDTTSGSATLSIVSATAGSAGGTVSVASDGLTLNYTPAANFNGAETFTYTAENQSGVERTATVTLQITDINDPPVALNDAFTVFRNSTLNVLEVLSNDTSGVDDASADTLTISAVSAGSAGGTITIGSSGLTLRYTPATDFQGSESFTYTLSDGRGGTSTGSVSVSVDQANPPPTPQNDNFTVTEDAAQASFDVLANDTTNDSSETLSVSAVGTPNFGGSVAVASDGQSILYRPSPNFSGTEIITYTLRDSGGATATGLVTFTVEPVNDAPTAVNDTLTALTSQGASTLNVLGNDVNVDLNETLTIIAVSQPPAGNGSLAISSDGLSLIYTPPSSTFEGSFAFTYTISDGNGLTDIATANVTAANFLPRTISGNLAFDDFSDTLLNGFYGLQVELTGNDSNGSPVSQSVRIGADGTYAFNDLLPGNYTLTRPPLPFLHDNGSSITINSAASDGDLVSNLPVGGSLRPEYFDIRDFLSSTSLNTLTVAVNSDGSQNWVSPQGDWSELSDLNFSLDTATNRLAITATNASQQAVSGSLAVGGNLPTQVVGQDASMRLLRIRTAAAAVGLTPVTAAASGEGEGSQASLQTDTSGLQAEGEGAELATPVIESVRSEPVRESETLVNPSEAIRRLLSSSGSIEDQVASRTASVDAAMASALPALQLQLADDLENDLTADPSDLEAASDSVFEAL